MRIVDLTEKGFPGYQVYENGKILGPNGNFMNPNANGQIKLVSVGGIVVWRATGWVVLTAFKEQPPGSPYVLYYDGDKTNVHIDNLEWHSKRVKASPKHDLILEKLRLGWSPELIAQEVDTSLGYVRSVAATRLKMLQTQFPNPSE